VQTRIFFAAPFHVIDGLQLMFSAAWLRYGRLTGCQQGRDTNLMLAIDENLLRNSGN
jgi:hypothetical protein